VKEKAAPIQGPAAKAPTTEPDAPKMAAPAPMAPRPVPALAPATTPPLPRSPAPPVAGSTSPAARRFHSLVTAKALTPGLLLASLAIAFVLGALHALQPGHGKTLVAAYLVGQRGTARHAVLLGLTVTVSHTFGVFLLGAVALFASQYVLPEELVPWMGFASGVLIAALGAGMLLARLRGAPSGQDHPHGHDHGHDHLHDHGHVHDHDHDQPHTHHEHDHSHAHAAAGVALHHGHDHTHSHTHSHAHPHGDALEHSHSPFGRHTRSHAVPDTLSLRSLIALGISGGIVPCWDALIVLLGAVAIHRTLLGMTLIVAFSAGLATTLTAAGLAVVWDSGGLGSDRWRRSGCGFSRWRAAP
jgi:ABC-type nickel/cobalt efflux system permease component RcnA